MDYFSAMRAFVRAAEFASFNKAALDLGVKNSTVSRHISDLERDLGIALFNRSTRGLVLTEGGRVFRDHALAVLARLDEARELTSALNEAPRGRLRVTLPVAFCRTQVAPHLAAFLARYPEIDLDLIVTDETLHLIERGIDVAIRIGTLDDSGLMARRLAPHRRIVCASPDYLHGRDRPRHPEGLAGHECLGFSRQTGGEWSLVRASATGVERYALAFGRRLAVDDSAALMEVALAGAGIALLPEWLAADALRAQRLVHLLPAWEARSGDEAASIWAVYPPKKTVSSKVRAFIDFLLERFGNPAVWSLVSPSDTSTQQAESGPLGPS